MTQRYKAYFTVPTGRQSVPSAANSSASDTRVLSKSSKRQQPSSSYVSIQHPQGRVNPFKFSLNLVVNVQPMDNNAQQQRWNGNVTSIATPSNVSAAQSDSRSSQDSSKSKTPTNRRYKNKQSLLRFSTLNKSRNNRLGTSLNDTLLPCRLNFDESDENEVVFGGESTDFRSSQASLKEKRKTQTTGNRRCKYKKSLLNKPRSKSTGTALPGFQHYPRPRPLSFNETVRSDDVSEFENMRSDADKTFPLDKTFRNSLGFNDSLCPRAVNKVGAVEAKSSFSHTSQDSLNVKNSGETDANKEIGAIQSKSFNSLFPQHPSNLAFSSFKKPRSKSTGTGSEPFSRPRRLSFNETMRSDADKQLVEVGAVEAKSSFSHTSQDSFNAKNGAVTYANTPVPLYSKAPVYNHQRQFRVGFIMNGVQTAVNCMVNIRSNDEDLYVEPVELLYEGEKMWRRPVRQVTKEMEEKIAADKKNQMK
uniref:Uncharacterized protein n=1 Tax=Panagrolaimus davidi TaxID=227884 RepID=A0A914Q1S1_9BILA